MAGRERARKRFGQNFLVDESIIERIVGCLSNHDPQATLVEIGPGRGALTAELVKIGSPLIALEIDRDLIPVLQTKFSRHPHFNLQQADALQFDFSSLHSAAPLRLVGNLPYNIATPLIFRLLDHLPLVSDMHFMLQWEVVARLAAGAGDTHYGQLSLVVQNLCDVEALFEVPAASFNPAPKVKSGFVQLRPRTQPQVPQAMQQTFTSLVKTAFSQRRKTLRNNLKSLLTAEQISAAGVDPATRAEQLTMQDFIALTQVASGETSR
jgi:16S rRNA (adenine1518-N6/adenine1519-N6)-dimethyltransferase